jgi:CheY-like chemotaxis protein
MGARIRGVSTPGHQGNRMAESYLPCWRGATRALDLGMASIRLIHWHAGEAATHARTLGALGHQVACDVVTGPEAFKRIVRKPPELFVICLDRLPSHGREVAGGLREFKSTRQIPILFVGGRAEKVARLKATLPGAVHTEWKDVGKAIRHAMANPPSLAALADSRFAGYSGTPLTKKLGIKEGSAVALVAPPEGFADTLGALPGGARLHTSARAKRDLTICFVRSRKALMAAIPRMVAAAQQGGVWVAWPKQASGLATDISERDVRAAGLAAGLVDHKICAIDATWSGLRFARRKA